jgi:hypothetical protein
MKNIKSPKRPRSKAYQSNKRKSFVLFAVASSLFFKGSTKNLLLDAKWQIAFRPHRNWNGVVSVMAKGDLYTACFPLQLTELHIILVKVYLFGSLFVRWIQIYQTKCPFW